MPESRASVDVAVLLPTLFGVRNVLHSSALDQLVTAGLRAAILPRECAAKSDAGVPAGVPCEPLLEPRRVGSDRGRSFLNGVLTSAFARRHTTMSSALYRSWFQRGARRGWRDAGMSFLGRIASSDVLFGRLVRLSERRYREAWDVAPVRERLRRLAPRLLWSTTSTSRYELPYVLAARDLGIPTTASILSFDNLTTRSLLPRFDHYQVWSDAMKQELLELYPGVTDADVDVTGTPQFDFHLRKECRWSRAATLERLGVPAAAKYFLYAAGHESLMPDEPRLVDQLASRLAASKELADFWLVVRLHPQDDGARWGRLAQAGRRVAVSSACEPQPDAEAWKRTRPEDQQLLISSLLHAEACLNIASTMSLDAAILDRPVIGIEFSAEPDSPRDIMYSAYGATHYRPIVESGGIALARSWGEVNELLLAATRSPERDREARARMVRSVCGIVDGGSTRRLVDSILGLLEPPGARALAAGRST